MLSSLLAYGVWIDLGEAATLKLYQLVLAASHYIGCFVMRISLLILIDGRSLVILVFHYIMMTISLQTVVLRV